MDLGLFIGRMNPPHHGHLSTIEKSLEENPKTLVLLGTAPTLSKEKNPLTFEEREFLLQKEFGNEINLTILKLLDNPGKNLEWNQDIQQKIDYNFPLAERLHMYYGENADRALQAVKEFSHTYRQILDFRENPRAESFIQVNSEHIPLSATNFRKLLLAGDFENARKFTSEKIFDDIVKNFQKYL